MATSMGPEYFQSLAADLLRGVDGIATVETYAEAGATGPQWTPTGLKVTTQDGAVTFLSIVRGSSTSVDAVAVSDLPVTYQP